MLRDSRRGRIGDAASPAARGAGAGLEGELVEDGRGVAGVLLEQRGVVPAEEGRGQVQVGDGAAAARVGAGEDGEGLALPHRQAQLEHKACGGTQRVSHPDTPHTSDRPAAAGVGRSWADTLQPA